MINKNWIEFFLFSNHLLKNQVAIPFQHFTIINCITHQPLLIFLFQYLSGYTFLFCLASIQYFWFAITKATAQTSCMCYFSTNPKASFYFSIKSQIFWRLKVHFSLFITTRAFKIKQSYCWNSLPGEGHKAMRGKTVRAMVFLLLGPSASLTLRNSKNWMLLRHCQGTIRLPKEGGVCAGLLQMPVTKTLQKLFL